MDKYNVNPRSIPESSYSPDRQDSLLLPTATSKSCPKWHGHSVQTDNSPHREYLNHQETNQDAFDLQYTLDDTLIQNLLPIEPLSIFAELITQKDLDEIVPVDGLTCSDSTKANLQQTTQESPAEHSPATFSHSSLPPITTTTPQAQQQVHTETAGHQFTESFDFGESTARSRAYRRNYGLAYGRTYRAEMAISGDIDKATKAAKAAGKAAGRAASRVVSQVQRELTLESSDKNQFLAIRSREDCIKDYIRAFANAYTKAYNKAFMAEISSSYNTKKAHQAAQAAGKAASRQLREHIHSSPDYDYGNFQPIPNFCIKTKKLFTIPLEPISP